MRAVRAGARVAVRGCSRCRRGKACAGGVVAAATGVRGEKAWRQEEAAESINLPVCANRARHLPPPPSNKLSRL